ncbi:MAG: hypothetical protein V4710_10960, partial [Verrucomicrobiota bacterium]
MLSHLFTTPVWHRRIHPAASELAELREYLLGLREEIPGEHLSNAGGWHSPGNLFVGETHRQFPFLNQAIREAVFAYLNAAFQFEGRIAFTLTGWAVVNG